MKAVTIFADNAARVQPSPTVQGVFLLFDEETGALRAIIDGPLITHWKTAADSLLGAQLLARPDAKRLVVIGAGALASALVDAYAAGFASLESIAVYARRPEKAAALIEASAVANIELTVVDDLRRAVEKADIISTATSSSTPVFRGAWVQPGCHVDLVGAYAPNMREADDALLMRGRLFVDCRETTVGHIGELLVPIKNGIIDPTAVIADLYELLRGQGGRTQTSDVTVYKNGGGAHLDLMIAKLIYDEWRT